MLPAIVVETSSLLESRVDTAISISCSLSKERRAEKSRDGLSEPRSFFPEVNVCLHKGAATNYSLRICHFPKADQKPPTAHLPILRELSFDWITLQPTSHYKIIPFRQQLFD